MSKLHTIAGDTDWPLKLIAAFLFVNLLAYCGNLYWELNPNPADWMYDVHILNKINDYNFTADVADATVKGQRNQFALTFCKDYQPTPEMTTGVTLVYLAYTRDIHMHCFAVGGHQYGYEIVRRNNVPIIDASFARQTTTQTTTRPD